MIDISVNELNKYYGANHLIKGISFEINSGEKVGLLGKNGSGKTTLFKIITGNEHYKSGSISKASGKKIEMLAQIPVFGENDTSEDILRSSFQEINNVFNAMKKIEGNADPAVLSRYGRLMEEYERLGGYYTEVRLDKICNGMNIDDRLRKSLFNQLSGGEKSRVNLVRILLRECDILLLDEPTNHLDIASREWIENALSDFEGTMLFVSHDRYFLNKFSDKVWSMENGIITQYDCGFDEYIKALQKDTVWEKVRKKARKKARKRPRLKRLSKKSLFQKIIPKFFLNTRSPFQSKL